MTTNMNHLRDVGEPVAQLSTSSKSKTHTVLRVFMNVVVLSPHRDDAAFSCSLLLRNLLLSGASVTIVNVCTVSNYAPYLDEDGAEPVQQVTVARATEDGVFISTLASDAHIDANTIRNIDLQWLDAPLRWNMEHRGAVQPGLARPEEVRELSRVLAGLSPYDLVLVPQAIGNHVDHVLVRDAALQSYYPASILFYEDLPYACRTAAELPVISDPSCEQWSPAASQLGGTKRKYAMCYPSQITPDVAEEMEHYGAALGGKERFCGRPEAIQKIRVALAERGADA